MAENLTDGQLTQEDLTIDSDSGSGDDDNWHSNKSSKGRVGSHVAQRWRYRELKTLKANLHSFLKVYTRSCYCQESCHLCPLLQEERIQLHEVLDGDKSKQFRTRTQFYRRLGMTSNAEWESGNTYWLGLPISRDSSELKTVLVAR